MTVRRLITALLLCASLTGCGGVLAGQPTVPAFPSEVGSWSRLPSSPLSARHEAAGAFVDGHFYVIGGWSGPPCPAAASCAAPVDPPHRDGASFDPRTGRWQPIAQAPVPIGGVLHPTVVRDRLYVLTGDLYRDDSPRTFLSYDPATDAWTRLKPPPAHDVELVAAGSTLVAVGYSDESTRAVDAAYDPTTDRWTRLPDDPLGPSFGRSATWLGDRLLLTASDLVPNPGAEGPSLTRLATLNATSTRWTRLPDSDIIGGNAMWVNDRVVFPMTGSADGGKVGNWGRDYFSGAVLDPATSTWSPLPQPPGRRTGLEGIVGTVGNRTMVGGHLLEPQAEEWTRLPGAPWGRSYRSAETIITGPSSIFVWGGSGDKKNLDVGYLLAL